MKSCSKLGFIVNPIAGMGGAVGLKGTDGKDTLEKAITLGAKPLAPYRAKNYLTTLKNLHTNLHLFAGAGMMGESEAKDIGFDPVSYGNKRSRTTSSDTKYVAQRLLEEHVDLIAFCGGDGTAKDMLDVVERKVPVIGVPTGVKMQSAVFSVNAASAAILSARFLDDEVPLKEAEIMDIDEEAFRKGRISARLYGYMVVPYEPSLIQGMKISTSSSEIELENQAAIAVFLSERVLEPDVIYVLGPGTTTRTVADILDQKKTLLGVDIMLNRKIIFHDANERSILNQIRGRKARIIVTPIGGQGFIFGRGNQQISPSVIRRVGLNNIIIIATKQKLQGLPSLKIDTGDTILDSQFRGYLRVIADYGQEYLMKVN